MTPTPVTVVIIHALLIARAQVQSDRDSVFQACQRDGVVEDKGDLATLAGYKFTLATIDEAIEFAKRSAEPQTVNHFHFDCPVDRRTAGQIGAEAGRALARATERPE